MTDNELPSFNDADSNDQQVHQQLLFPNNEIPGININELQNQLNQSWLGNQNPFLLNNITSNASNPVTAIKTEHNVTLNNSSSGVSNDNSSGASAAGSSGNSPEATKPKKVEKKENDFQNLLNQYPVNMKDDRVDRPGSRSAGHGGVNQLGGMYVNGR